MHLNKGNCWEGERGMGRVRRVQFTANRGQERTGISATARRRDFQVSKGGIFQTKRGVARKGVVGMSLNVYIVLIKDCVKVINKPCVRDARYVRLISWIP
jgi:hypothetical protein